MRQIFHQLPWLYPEDPPEVKELYYKHGKTAHYKKGDILKRGGESQKLFHLVKGMCAYFLNYAEGKPRSFAIILPGSSMCDLTCITQERVNVTTIVMRDSDLLLIPPNTLLNAMKNDAELAIKVCRMQISKQESSLEATTANFTHEPAMRLKILMKALFAKHNIAITEWNKLPIVVTNEEFGLFIDSTRVTVNRVLSAWLKEGLIKKEGKQIFVRHNLFDDVYDWLSV